MQHQYLLKRIQADIFGQEISTVFISRKNMSLREIHKNAMLADNPEAKGHLLLDYLPENPSVLICRFSPICRNSMENYFLFL